MLAICDKQWGVCVDEGAAQLKREQAAQRCLAISADKKYYGDQVDQIWRQKKYLLQDGQKTLQKVKSDLESDYAWNVGDPGSAREMVTSLAMVTKTTTDLIEGLGGFSNEKAVGAAKDIYEGIKDGKTAYKMVTDDASKVVVDVILDAGSQASALIRAAKTTKEFAENMQKIANLPKDLANSRSEFKRQMDGLDQQISSIQGKIDQIEREHEPSEVEELFQTYQSVRQMCQ